MTKMTTITSNKHSELIKLSIQVRLNGLSFCILNSGGKEILWYKKKDFPNEYNPVKILEQIELMYEKEPKLQQPVDEVVLLFSSDLYSFVPKEYFNDSEASNYLKFNTKILKTDVVAFDEINEKELVNVYIPYTNITNYFFDKYGEFEYKHSTSVLAQAFLNGNSENDVVNVYLNNYTGYYDLVVIKNNRLLLSNSFSYQTKEDFIYYLLFSAEQLKLDPGELKLILLGDISEDSELYQIAYTYIKNIEFLEPNFSLAPEEKKEAGFQRQAYPLLKSLGCE